MSAFIHGLIAWLLLIAVGVMLVLSWAVRS